MKKLLYTILFALLAIAASAQSRVLTRDSVYIENKAGTFFRVRVIEYSNGEGMTQTELIGDTSAVINQFRNTIQGRASGLATDAAAVYQFRQTISELIRQGNQIQTQFGTNPVRLIQNDFSPNFTGNSWTIRNDTTRTIAFTVNAQGQLRYQIAGFTARNARLLGNVMRLENYQSAGKDLDLFRVSENRYTTLDGLIVLRIPGQSQRSAAPPTVDETWMERTGTPEPAPAPEKPKRKRKKD